MGSNIRQANQKRTLSGGKAGVPARGGNPANPGQNPMPARGMAEGRGFGGPQGDYAMENPGMGQEEEFNDLVDALTGLLQSGRLPEGFDLTDACADPEFVELMREFPPEAAVRIYDAERRAENAENSAMDRVSAQARSRRALPQSTRGGGLSAPGPNYKDMDSASFKRLLTDMKKTARDGGRTRL